MRSLLDSILDNYTAQPTGPVILSEDHSAAASEGCASLDTSNGTVALMTAGAAANKTRWHKYGTSIRDAADWQTARSKGRLTWTMSKRPTFYRDRNGDMKESLTTWAIVRDDTDEQLHTVGTDYEIVQNDDGFYALNTLMGEFGAKYETAGALRGGRQVFLQVTLPQGFEIVRGDRVESVATFMNSNCGGKAHLFKTAQRIVCSNTYAIAEKDSKTGFSMKHTGDVREKIGEMRDALAASMAGFEKFRSQAEVMVRTQIPTQRKAIEVFDNILDVVLDITAAERIKGADALAAALLNHDAKEKEAAAKKFQRQIDRRGNILNDILDRYDSHNNRVGGIQGTGWAAFNAVTEHTNHAQIGRKVGTQEDRDARRFEEVLSGDAAQFNHVALEKILALAN